MPQTTPTLKLIRNFCFNPKLSEYADLHGMFDYNKTMLAPFGTIVLVHNNTTNCLTWESHGTYVWYIGPALDNY